MGVETRLGEDPPSRAGVAVSEIRAAMGRDVCA